MAGQDSVAWRAIVKQSCAVLDAYIEQTGAKLGLWAYQVPPYDCWGGNIRHLNGRVFSAAGRSQGAVVILLAKMIRTESRAPDAAGSVSDS